MTLKIVPREAVWPGRMPCNSDGSARPLLGPDRPWLTVHYTGGGLWLDPDDTPQELRSIQAYAAGVGKPWEYNWVIDGQGMVWEYAGDYRAAHSAGENTDAIGVLLLVGFSGHYPDVGYWEPPTTEMVAAVRELRYWLVERNMLDPNHDMLQHRQMPGAATTCPGEAVMRCWPELCKPLDPPTPPGDDEMKQNYYVVTGANARFIGTPAQVFWTGPGTDKALAGIQLQLDEGNLVLVDLTGGPNAFGATFLAGRLPEGDTLHDWTGDEFAGRLS